MLTSFGANVPVFWSECLLLFCKSPALHHSKPGFRGQKSPAFLRFFFRFTGFREKSVSAQRAIIRHSDIIIARGQDK